MQRLRKFVPLWNNGVCRVAHRNQISQQCRIEQRHIAGYNQHMRPARRLYRSVQTAQRPMLGKLIAKHWQLQVRVLFGRVGNQNCFAA